MLFEMQEEPRNLKLLPGKNVLSHTHTQSELLNLAFHQIQIIVHTNIAKTKMPIKIKHQHCKVHSW